MRRGLVIFLLFLSTTVLFAQEGLSPVEQVEQRVSLMEGVQEKISALKISGYLQTQWQWNQSDDSNTFSIRRGRIKTAYSTVYGQAVMQIDITEKGVGIKDAYIQLVVPGFSWLSLTAGIFDRPFGYEISYSSSRRESAERSLLFRTLFPDERDLGAKLTFQGPKGTIWNNLTINAGLFNGNGIAGENSGDSYKDFIGRIGYVQPYQNFSIGGGFSYYNGRVVLRKDQEAFKVENRQFVNMGLSAGDFLKREYFGFDAQFLATSILGVTNIRGEFLWGTQPGQKEKSGSASSKGAINAEDLYLRSFSGANFYLVQDIGQTKHSLVFKYDYYDPNVQLGKEERLTKGDQAYNTLGFGYLYRMTANLRLMAYYDMVRNEFKSSESDKKDDILTLRVQYKF